MPRMAAEMRQKVEGALDAGCPCGGATARMTLRLISGNSTIHMQCETCGRSVAGSLKRSEHYDFGNYPLWDTALSDRYHASEQIRRDPAAEERARVLSASRAAYREEFLRSPAWRALRVKVLKRANYSCEACLNAAAEDVHHIRYGLDLLPPAWDLRAVCRPCHDALHGGRAAWSGQ